MVYVLSSLSTCKDTLREVNNLVYDFLLDGKGDKIERTVMSTPQGIRLKKLHEGIRGGGGGGGGQADPPLYF